MGIQDNFFKGNRKFWSHAVWNFHKNKKQACAQKWKQRAGKREKITRKYNCEF